MSTPDDAEQASVDGSGPGRAQPPAPWLAWPRGAKVMVRRRLADGGFADTVGLLVEADEQHVLVRGRRGDVRVPADEIAIGKLVPPPVLGPRRPGEARRG